MSKLKLRIENLAVESLETSAIRAERGTVMGAAESNKPGCADNSDYSGGCCEYTWAVSCVQSHCEVWP